MSCFDFSRIFKESAASESFWQLIAILDFNCPGLGRMRTRGWGASYYRAAPAPLSHVFVRMEERKRLMKGIKICIWLHMGAIIDPRRARGHGQRVIHSSNLIKNNLCLRFMTTESMALRVLFVCNFLLDETCHWNVFRLFVTWYHLGVRWQF